MFAAFYMLCIALAQALDKQVATQNELRQLQGEWTVVYQDLGLDGFFFDFSPPQRLGWLFSSEKWTIRNNTITLTSRQTLVGRLAGYGDMNRASSITHEQGGKVTVITQKAGNRTNLFRIDPSKTPKQIDGVFNVFDPCVPAIYSLENNVLTIAIPVSGIEDGKKEPRPTRFVTGKAAEFGVYVVRLKQKQAAN